MDISGSFKSKFPYDVNEHLKQYVTLTTEHALSPIMRNIAILEQCKTLETLSQLKKGCSKKAKTTLEYLDSTVDSLIRKIDAFVEERGHILSVNPELHNDLSHAINQTKEAGFQVHQNIVLLVKYVYFYIAIYFFQPF